MSRPFRTDRFDAVVAEAPPLADAPVVAGQKAAVKLALGGDELIHFSIRPSPWFVLIITFNWLIGVGLLLAAASIVARSLPSWQSAVLVQGLIGALAVRVGVALLQWASRTYILTNRRVMRIKGVLSVDVAECPLARVTAVTAHSAWHQNALRLGSITVAPADERWQAVVWEHLAHTDAIHETLVRAIRKAQSGDSL